MTGIDHAKHAKTLDDGQLHGAADRFDEKNEPGIENPYRAEINRRDQLKVGVSCEGGVSHHRV